MNFEQVERGTCCHRCGCDLNGHGYYLFAMDVEVGPFCGACGRMTETAVGAAEVKRAEEREQEMQATLGQIRDLPEAP